MSVARSEHQASAGLGQEFFVQSDLAAGKRISKDFRGISLLSAIPFFAG